MRRLLDLGVETDGGGLQHPVIIADRAAGVAHPLQFYRAARQHIDVLGEAASVAIHELEVRPVEIRCAVDIVATRDAVHAQFWIREVHVALDRDPAGLLVIRDRIGGYAARVLPDVDAAVQNGIAVRIEEGIVTVDVKPMIVHGDVRIDPGLVLRRGGTHVSRADRESGRQAKDNECGSNMKRHGQNASP